MSENEINIAIAEACGWHITGGEGSPEIGTIIQGYKIDPDKLPSDQLYQKQLAIPNYCHDLNAMHEAWKSLKEAKRTVFAETLFAVTKGEVIYWGYYPGDSEIEWNQIGEALNATSRQRAEAFLRTIRKWKDA